MWCHVSWKCVLNHLVKGCASVKQLCLPVQLIIIATWGHLREHNNYNRNVAEAMWEAFGNWMALDIWWMTRQVNVMEEWRWIFRRPWKISTPGFIALGMTLNSKRFWFSKLFHHLAIKTPTTQLNFSLSFTAGVSSALNLCINTLLTCEPALLMVMFMNELNTQFCFFESTNVDKFVKTKLVQTR